MNFKYTVFQEPLLEFRYGQKLEDPHDGLYLFGPYSADKPSHPEKIKYALIGTKRGINLFKNWTEHVMNAPQIEESSKLRLWPPFPGFKEAFSCEFPNTPSWIHNIDENKLLEASRYKNEYERTYRVANMFIEAFDILEKKDESFDIAIIVVPDEIYMNCRPESRVKESWGYRPPMKNMKSFKKGQTTLEDDFENRRWYTTEKYNLSVDFRRQIKSRIIKYNIPIQIIRESTLSLQDRGDEKRGVTPLSDRAWNLSTAIFYKSGGKPWKLASARDGVSYIGISFKIINEKTACCTAQMFLDSGDGIVFLGEEGPWYSPERKQFELSREAAKRLLSGTLETYSKLGGETLKEIFIHSHSSLNKEAFLGFRDACPKNVKLIGVVVRKEKYDIRLYRLGKMPVLRGSFLKIDDKTGYLWASGFKPRIDTYDGWEVPIPLKIFVQYGEAPIEQVAKDILALTKLNYNACKLGDSEPVTIKFSDAVGEILISNPGVKERRSQFKFYI